VWSKADYTDIVKTIKELMLKAGFKRLNEIDLYEKIQKSIIKVLNFIIRRNGEWYKWLDK
jgi:uncharacterized protein (DUF302 family)